MDKHEYFRGLFEVGIVPRAPHSGPLVRNVFEQEHGELAPRRPEPGA